MMKDLLKKFNKGKVTYSKEKLFRALDTNTRLYFDSCNRLYELGYLTSPFDFKDTDFWKTLFEEDSSAPALFINKRTGGMEFNAVRTKQVASETKKEVYRLLFNVLSSRDNINALTQFAENVASRYKLSSDSIVINPNITCNAGIKSMSKMPLDNPVIINCLKADLVATPIAYIAYNSILDEWGITADGESLFMGEGYTEEDDIVNLKHLISGAIEGHGSHIEDLYLMASEYEAEEQESNGYDFYTYLLCECSDEIYTELESDFAYVTDTYLYRDSEMYSPVIWNKPDYIGTDLVDAFTGNQLPASYKLLGYTGKFIPIEYKSYLGLEGADFYIDMLGRNYFPVLDTEDYAMPPTLQHKSVEVICKELEIERIEDLEKGLSPFVNFIHPGNPDGFRILVGKLVTSLVCVIADYTIQGQKYPNHVVWGKDFDWVTKNDYYLACKEAERLYNLLF